MQGGSFILMFNPNDCSTLLGLRNKYTNWYPNTWCPFGGTIENGEEPIQTAKREYIEETQIYPDMYNLDPYPLCLRKTIGNTDIMNTMFLFLGILKNKINPIINDESQNYNWIDINNLSKFMIHPILITAFNTDSSLNRIQQILLGDK